MPKPLITFDSFRREWRCQTVFDTPGEICFVTGVGATIQESYARWKEIQRAYDKRINGTE